MAPKAKNIDGALRAGNIVALLEHKPGPGIYSRLERAVQQLPENVRVQELPGLLKRYKDGIPGWELRAVDLESVVAGRTTVPRDELLAAVRERSPVFTHKEVVLGGNPPMGRSGIWHRAVRQDSASRIGEGVSHGEAKYNDYGQGGDDYSEVLLLQPGAKGEEFGSHWGGHPQVQGTNQAVAHLRYDTHGDALRINELQSDLGIHNRKMREQALARRGDEREFIGRDAETIAAKDRRQSDSSYIEKMRELGLEVAKNDEGGWVVRGLAAGNPFPLEDAWADILTKRALLQAARDGKQAIEVASPRAIADKVGGNIDNYEHFYGKVVPGSLERLGRKMGGLREELISELSPRSVAEAAEDRLWRETPEGRAATSAFMEMERIRTDLNARYPSGSEYGRRGIGETVERIVMGEPWRSDIHHRDAIAVRDVLWNDFESHGYAEDVAKQMADKEAGAVIREMQRMQDLARMEHETTRAIRARAAAEGAGVPLAAPAGRRYVLSDEMRKRIINEGIPAAIAIGAGTGLAAGGNEAEAKPFGRGVDGFRQTAWGLKAPGPNEEKLIRSLIKPSERRQVEQLTKQLDEAYANRDFARAEELDAQLEQQLENLDSRLSQTTEDTEADFTDWEPNDYEGAASNYEEQMRDIYGSYVAGGPHYQNEADLANALRGVAPDTDRASKISDADIIREAKAAFEGRQAQIAKARSGSPEDGIRSMQTRLRQAGLAGAMAPMVAGESEPSAVRESRTPGGWLGNQMAQRFGTLEEAMAGLPTPKVTPDQPATGFDYSMAISPAEWEQYDQQRRESGRDDPEHYQFKKNVDEVLGSPMIRVGAARGVSKKYDEFARNFLVSGDDYDRISPQQFIQGYIDNYLGHLPQETKDDFAKGVVDKLKGELRTSTPHIDRATDYLLTALKESAPKGAWAKNDPMPQEQLDSLRQQYGDWADSMLTAGGAENFQAQRGLELLRAAQDGEHAPSYADSASNAVAFTKGFVDPQARKDFADLALKSGPAGRFAKANRDFYGSRTRFDEPPAFRNPDGSSRYADTSTSNIRGLLRAGGDTSNGIGWAAWPMYEAFSELSRTPVGKAFGGEGIDSLWSKEGWSDWNHMAKQRDAFAREQPVNPGMSPEQFQKQEQAYKQDRKKGEAWGATTFPNVQEAFTNLTGVPTTKTWGMPLYNDYGPNFFQNNVGNPVSAGIMVASAGTGGILGGLAGAASPKGGVIKGAANVGRGIAKGIGAGATAAAASQVADLPFDFATDQTLGGAMAGNLMAYRNYMLTPESDNALLPGVDPNSMSVDELNRRRRIALQQREDEFRSNKESWGQQ